MCNVKLRCEDEIATFESQIVQQWGGWVRLLRPFYLMKLEPPNAIGDAKANRQHELTLGLAEDCFFGARLLINDRTGQTRATDPKRIELAKQVLARALKLAPENEAYRKLAADLGMS